MQCNEQLSLAQNGFDRYARRTKRAQFLEEMSAVVPWERLCDVIRPHYLLHGNETRVWGDAAYGQTAVIRSAAPAAADFTGRYPARSKHITAREREIHRTKSRVRSRVEQVFHVVKRIFGFSKVRYRGIAKNAHRLVVNFALANLHLSRRRLLA